MSDNYQGPERRTSKLSDEEFERIAIRSKELVLQDLYVAVGKSVIAKALWVLGAASLVVAAYLSGKGELFK